MPQGLSLADFQAVLFDVDGTLVDTLPALIKGLGDSYEHFNQVRPSDGQIQATIGLPLRKQMRMFTDKEVTESELEERMNYTVSRFEAYSDLEKEFAPAVKTLQLVIQSGRKTALVTSKSALEVSLFRKRFSWFASVDTIICSSDVTHPKPDPESVQLACQQLGVSPQQAVYIGDAVFDMQSASKAGASAVAVGYGSGTRQALLDEHPQLFFETPDALLAWAKESIYTTSCFEGRT